MAKPYHIKLKRTTKNLSDTQVQNYSDLKWGEPLLTNDGHLVIGDKSTDTPDADNPDNYQSHAVSDLKVFKSVAQTLVETISSVKYYLADRFTFWKTASSVVTTGKQVTLTDEAGNNLRPNTDANFVAYNASSTYTNGTVGKAVTDKADKNNTALTGTPTAPDINNASTNSQIATKNYVENTVNGTSGYLAKFTGAHTVGNGPQLGTADGTFLNKAGQWATPADTRVAQEGSAVNGDFPILFKANANTTNETNKALFGNKASNSITANPSNGTINAVTMTATTGTFTNLTKGGNAVATESYVGTAISNMGSFIKVVDAVPTTTDPAEIKKLYVVKMTATSGSTTYTEYVPYIYDSGWKPLSAIW